MKELISGEREFCNISHKRFWQPGADENSIHGVLPDVEVSQEDVLNTALKIRRKDL